MKIHGHAAPYGVLSRRERTSRGFERMFYRAGAFAHLVGYEFPLLLQHNAVVELGRIVLIDDPTCLYFEGEIASGWRAKVREFRGQGGRYVSLCTRGRSGSWQVPHGGMRDAVREVTHVREVLEVSLVKQPGFSTIWTPRDYPKERILRAARAASAPDAWPIP